MKLRNSWVIVKRDENEEKFPGTMILLPDTRYTDSPLATVLDTGPGRQKRSDLKEYIDVKSGDRVVIDNVFTTDRNKLPDGTFIVDVKEIEAVVRMEQE